MTRPPFVAIYRDKNGRPLVLPRDRGLVWIWRSKWLHPCRRRRVTGSPYYPGKFDRRPFKPFDRYS